MGSILVIYYLPWRTYYTFGIDENYPTYTYVLDGAFLILIVGAKCLGLCVLIAFRKLMSNAEV